MKLDEKFMEIAIGLAKEAEGRTSPNPIVGAVVVKNKRIVGKGYHKMAGLPHAEKTALRQAKDKAKGADLYVTLEPCDHYGRTPPCTDSIIESGVRRVVIGMLDPNPVNSGRGMSALRKNRIKTTVGTLEAKVRAINKPYIKSITTGRPYVTLKVAQTLDGKIAARSGDSKWISGEYSRRSVHELRSKVDAVMVGVNTILKDDPLLTVRIPGLTLKKPPARIIVDSTLKTPLQSNIIKASGKAPVIIATTKKAGTRRMAEYRKKGAEIIVVDGKNGRVDLPQLLKRIAQKGINHILVEGGGELIAGILKEGLADHVKVFIAPKIIGGKDSPTSVGGRGIGKVKDALLVRNAKIANSGEDFMIEGDV
ncbi:bifunctional diaminohydroxyphosphoribosylaminopyrimidine deaminase/5-amino-6-(5-phosphoribosylamino)uracil reductase RibD [Candidatus Omnitrophota bacterium]